MQRRTTAALLLCALGPAGCSTTRHEPVPLDLSGTPGSPAVATSRAPIGYSVEGRPIEMEVLGDGHDCILVIASIHGDEGAGTPLVNELRDRLSLRPGPLDGRTVVIVSKANPDGLARGVRTNARGVDLNRDFPAENGRRRGGPRDAAAPQPETRAIMKLVERYQPSRIVSIHQPLTCIDYDGPAEDLARAMAKACDLNVRKLGARPGSLGSWAGVDRGIPVVTVELPPSASRASGDALWERYGGMMLSVLRG